MLNVVSVGIGIAIFIFSLILFRLTYKVSRTQTAWWTILSVLVIFFLIGYLYFEYCLITGKQPFDLNFMVAQVFLWGAVFVLICATLFYSTTQEKIALLTQQTYISENLKDKLREIEKVNKLMVGRELDMVELKKEINNLLKELGRPDKYRV
jgi:hypothetical protein